MANLAYGSLQLCRLRVGLLDAAGAPDPDTNGLYVTDAPIQLNYQLVLKEGAKFEQENGCGQVCLTFQDRDKIQSVNLAMELCRLDAELIELLTGAHLVTVGGNTRGFAIPNVDEELDREVSIEAWSKAWDGDQAATLAGNVLHDRFIFPRTTWVLGDGTLENAPLRVPVTGRGKSNALFADGPANDLPYDEYLTPMGVYFDDDPLPDALDTYQSLVAS